MYRLCRYLDPVTLTYISCSSDFVKFYVNVRYLLNYKAYNHQTLHSASSGCTVLADTLTQWPWPIFCTAVTLTHFTSTFGISSTIRPITTIPCIVLSSMYWLGRYLDSVTLTYISSSSDFYTFYVNVPLSLSCIIQKVSAAYCAGDIAIRGNDTGWEYMCPTGHFVYIFF